MITGAATYGITSTAIGAMASWSVFRAAVTRFMVANAASGPDAVRLLLRPEIWNVMDNVMLTSTAVSEWDRMIANIPASAIAMTTNALAAPAGSPLASNALLTTAAGGVAPTRPTDDLALASYRLHGLTQALEILTNGQELGEDLIKSNAAHCLIDTIAKLSEQVTELVDRLDRQLRGAERNHYK